MRERMRSSDTTSRTDHLMGTYAESYSPGITLKIGPPGAIRGLFLSRSLPGSLCISTERIALWQGPCRNAFDVFDCKYHEKSGSQSGSDYGQIRLNDAQKLH